MPSLPRGLKVWRVLYAAHTSQFFWKSAGLLPQKSRLVDNFCANFIARSGIFSQMINQ